MRPDDEAAIDALLADIIDWSARIEAYLEGLDYQSFENRQMAGRILKISPNFQQHYPALELQQAYRARNRTAHGYGSISLPSIWRSATFAAPGLAGEATRVLDTRRSSGT